MIYSNYNIYTPESNSKIYCDLNGNEYPILELAQPS